MITRRTPISDDVQDVLRNLSVHEQVDESTRALIVRVLNGESTENTVQDARRATAKFRVLTANRFDRANYSVAAALDQIVWVDVWAAHVSPSNATDLARQSRVWLDSACSDLGISHNLETLA